MKLDWREDAARFLAVAAAAAIYALLGADHMPFEQLMQRVQDMALSILVGWLTLRRPRDVPKAVAEEAVKMASIRPGPGPSLPPADLMVLLLLALTIPQLQGCPAQTGPAKWPGYVECGSGVVTDLIGTVARILMSGQGAVLEQGGKKELEQLAVTHGASTVACLVDKLVRDWTAPGAAAPPERVAAAARGRAFLEEVGTVTHGE